jgi:hypothetical protein
MAVAGPQCGWRQTLLWAWCLVIAEKSNRWGKLRGRCALIQKSGRLAEPIHQCGQTRAVFIIHCRDLQCQSKTGLYAPYNSVGPDLSLLNKKLQLDCGTQAPGR